MEQAFAAIPAAQRPRPNLDKLRRPVPELKSIVTHPPLLGTASASGGPGAEPAV
jgi:hypothetical protein